jgi:hypothetical protein
MTVSVSANAAPTTSINTKPAARPRAFVPPIEFQYNIGLMKDFIKVGKFEEAASVFVENGFAPDFAIADITRLAPSAITLSVFADFSAFVRNALSPENTEKRGIKMSALLRASLRFSAPQYFEEKVKLFAAISAAGAKVPSIVASSCESIEADLKRRLTASDWARCGFEVKSSNPGQTVYFNPELNKTIVINTPKQKPTSEADKAKEKEHKQGTRRSRQLERAAQFPGKIGVNGNKQSEGSGKKGKKK